MIPTDPHLLALHEAYCGASGRQHTWTMSVRFVWEHWSSHGWTEADLRLVIALVRQKIAAGQKWPSALGFRNLIQDEDGFNELLAEARSKERAPKYTERDRVLEQSGRAAGAAVVGNQSVRSAGQIIAAEKAFQAFIELKKTL